MYIQRIQRIIDKTQHFYNFQKKSDKKTKFAVFIKKKQESIQSPNLKIYNYTQYNYHNNYQIKFTYFMINF